MNLAKTDVAKIITIECVFRPNKFISENIWAISLIRERGCHSLESEIPPLNQHVSIFLQELRNGVVKLTKMHGIHNINNNPGKLTLQCISNEDQHINIQIRNYSDLFLAASALCRMSLRSPVKNPIDDFIGKTWLVPAEKGQELLDLFSRDLKQLQVSKLPFWEYGTKSVVHHMYRRAKLSFQSFIYKYVIKGIHMGNPVLLFSVAPFLTATIFMPCKVVVDFVPYFSAYNPIITSIAYNAEFLARYVPLVAITILLGVAKFAHDAEEHKNPGHNCFTWARDSLIQLNIPEITEDMKSKWFDYFIAMPSLYLLPVHTQNTNQIDI